MANLQYITIGGERWDTIAVEYYGTSFMMNNIMEANPTVPTYDNFPAGVVLNIPIIDKSEVTIDPTLLPPWKR
jgi:phage tail protein X